MDANKEEYQGTLPPWDQPRYSDGFWRMDLNIWKAPGVLSRCGRVMWNANGTGYFEISVRVEGYGFPCFPSYRALSDAQDAVEELIRQSIDELKRRNGREWPQVVK